MQKLYSQESEVAVLTLAIRYKNIRYKVISELNELSFIYEPCKKLFKTLKECNSSGINADILTLSEMSKVDISQIQAITNSACSKDNIDTRIKILKSQEKKRHLKYEIDRLSETLHDYNLDEIISNLSDLQAGILNNKTGVDTRLISNNMGQEIADRILSKDIDVKSSPMNLDIYPCLNRNLNGIQREKLYVIAGMSGSGKTAFALNIATCISKKNKVYFQCLEMSVNSIQDRIIADICDLDSYNIQTHNLHIDQEKNIIEKCNLISIYIDPINNDCIDNFISRFKARNMIDPFDVVILDYLNLFKDKSVNHQRADLEVAEITRKLKILSVECKVAVILLAQFTGVQKTEMPVSADNLKGSSAIRQDADCILLVDKEKPSFKPTDDMCIVIAKNRTGKLENIRMKYIGSRLRFVEK
jgi:replicative DNA helicase